MTFLKVMRILVTIVLVIALLIGGGIALFNFSVSRVILDEDFFGEHLLESGTYTDLFENFTGGSDMWADFEDETDKAGNIFLNSFTEEMLVESFSEIGAEYLSDWMRYLKGQDDIEDVPVLKSGDFLDTMSDYAQDLLDDEEFMIALLEDNLEWSGDSIDNYSQEEYIELIASMEIEENYIASIEDAMNDPEVVAPLMEYEDDPVAIFRGTTDLSDEEILQKMHDSYGVLRRYDDISTTVYNILIGCVLLLFVMWITSVNVPLIINGIVFILSSLPLLFFAVSEVLFNGIIRFFAESMLEERLSVNVYNLSALKPIIASMTSVSAIVFALGIVMLILGIIVGKNKKAQSSTLEAQNL